MTTTDPDAPAETTQTAETPRKRRRRWPWILGGILAFLAAAGVALTLIFQFGLPWWSGEGDHNHIYVSEDGAQQHYQVHLPPQYEDGGALPVMMSIHGCGMTGFGVNSMKESTQFNDLADREGFIVVYPTQRPFENIFNCWNSADPGNQIRGAGEPALLAGVAREVVETYGADPDRIHVSGASSGAGTAVIMGVTYPDIFATVTSVAGGEYGLNRVDPSDPDSTPPSTTARQAWAEMADRARHVPVLIVQGGADDVVPTLVGERLIEHWSIIDDLVDDGLINDSLALVAETVEHPAAGDLYSYEHTTIRDAEGTVLIEYVFSPELGHAWSGPAGEGLFTDVLGPDAAELAWALAVTHDEGEGAARR